MDPCDSTPTKICTKCGVEKPVSGFHKHTKKKIGVESSCKACKAAYNRIRYLEKQEEMKARGRAWYAANNDRMRAAKAIYCASNADSVAAKKAEWAKANRNRIYGWQLARDKANPQAKRVYSQNRRARKINNGGRLSVGLAKRLFLLQRGKCPCCNQPLGDGYHLDHIVPLALGGTHTDDNIQLLRASCNLYKHTKHPVDFMQSRGFLI